MKCIHWVTEGQKEIRPFKKIIVFRLSKLPVSSSILKNLFPVVHFLFQVYVCWRPSWLLACVVHCDALELTVES